MLSFLLIAPMWLSTATASPQIEQRTETKRISTTSRFTITYPDHWIETQNSRDYVIIYNQQSQRVGGGLFTSLYMIKTDVSLQNMSLRQALQSHRDNPRSVNRTEEVTVNGRLGVRLWLYEDLTGTDSIVTYIPLSESTLVYIVSFYYKENQFAEPAILQVHNSLRIR